MALDTVFSNIISTPDGVAATSGKELENKFNDNFKKTKLNLDAIWDVLSTLIASPNITGMRLNVATGGVEYTLDEMDGEVTWIPFPIRWFDLFGDPMSNTELKALFDSKASQSEFQDLQNRFVILESISQIHTGQIETAQRDISELKIKVDDHEFRLGNVETAVNEERVFMKKGDFITIAFNPTNNNLDFSIDGGTTYKPIVSGNVQWSVLTGDPTDNPAFNLWWTATNIDLETELNDGLTNLQGILEGQIATKADDIELDNHKMDYNNPHNVDFLQLQPKISTEWAAAYKYADLPMSNEVIAEFQKIYQAMIQAEGVRSLYVTSRIDYDNKIAIDTLDPDALYFVSRKNQIPV